MRLITINYLARDQGNEIEVGPKTTKITSKPALY